MRFTSDEAFEADAEGDPIMITVAAALKMLDDHCLADAHDAFRREVEIKDDRCNAAHVLIWLGY